MKALATALLLLALASSFAGLAIVWPQPRSVDYARLEGPIEALGEALAAQQAKIVGGLLSPTEPAGDSQLRAARNNALGSVPAALTPAQSAVNEIYSSDDPVGRDQARRMAEELSRVPEIERRLLVAVERLQNGIGDGSFSESDITEAARALAGTADEAREIGTHVHALFRANLSRAVQSREARNDEQRRAAGLWFFAGAFATAAALFFHRRSLAAGSARETALSENLKEAQNERTQEGSETQQLRQGERRAQLDLALLRIEQRSLTESLRSALILCDPSLRIRLTNAAATARFALPSNSVGAQLSSLAGLQPLIESLGGTPALEDAIEHGKPLETRELEVGGEPPYWLFLRITPYFDEAGKVRGAILVADDITEQQRTRARLMHSERLAAMGRLSAQVAHEIRNPLSSLALNVDLLAEEIAELQATSETTAHIAAITREIERLSEVTEEYLRLARLRPPQMERESLGALINELAGFMSEDFKQRQITCTVNRQRDLYVMADAPQLRQALMNILRNSMESMPNGGALSMTLLEKNARAEIEVRDSGSGIPEHLLQRIFDPFYTTKDGGTGLGLPITQQIVAEHGGEMHAGAASGGGTAIVLSLPLADDRVS